MEMTPDIDKREGLGKGIYAKFVQNYEKLLEENKKLKEENKKLKEEIKDHQFYEEKLEHRIIEFEELLHGE